MTQELEFHVLTVGWNRLLLEGLWDAIAEKNQVRFSHVMHPSYVLEESLDLSHRSDIHFFRDRLRQRLPDADPEFLASLEQADVPTIHNMILGDRVLSKIDYGDALRYATFLARRLIELLGQIKPTVIIGGFDSIHGSIALAVARYMNIHWFALNFSVIPLGLACFCDRMSPAARVYLTARPRDELRSLAELVLRNFESRKIQAPAYVAPRSVSLQSRIRKLPSRISALARVVQRIQLREYLQFTQGRSGHSISAALSYFYRAKLASKAIQTTRAQSTPPNTPYVLFGLHFQPESSIDVWAPFFSNQMWVIELLSRSIPPSHKLLVKIHKSDVANYSRAQLERMQAFPGVELVMPFADTRAFIERADLVIAIQGTMGLEAALLGKRVIMLGDSPVAIFPSASLVGEIVDLPMLIRHKLAESAPTREEIVEAYASYLAPLVPASYNDWRLERGDEEIDGYVELFTALKEHLARSSEIRLGVPL